MSITPQPAPAQAPAPVAENQADVRAGTAVVLVVVAAFLALVAGVLLYNPYLVAGADAESWRQAFRHKGVWPVVVWCGLLAVGALAGAGHLVQLGKRPDGNEPKALAKPMGIGLLVMALFAAAIPLYLLVRSEWDYAAALGLIFLWACAMALGGVIAGVLLLVMEDSGTIDATRFRLTVAGVGGGLGMACALLGFALPVARYDKTIMGGPEAWRANPLDLLWCVAALIGGLALMFVSAQLGRRLERKSQNVRRLVYGFNAVLTGLLLLAVLAVPNVLAYAEPFSRFTGRPLDWTRDNVHSVSPQLRQVLADLRDPVKVTVLLPRDNQESQQMQNLLEHCRNMSSKFSWELISPTSPANEEAVKKLMERYTLPEPFGVLVAPADAKESKAHEFIRYRDLSETEAPRGDRSRENAPRKAFKGENALLQALIALTEGKTTVYFTQGHGELSLEGAAPRIPGMPPPRGEAPEKSMSRLRQLLSERRSVEVRPLAVDANLKKVPDDASAVIVAGPTQAFTPPEVKVLSDYLARKQVMDKDTVKVTAGKLILCLPPVTHRRADRTVMAPTGLEDLLTAYNVKPGEDRVLQMKRAGGDPTNLVGVTDPRSSNPVAKAFGETSLGPRVFTFKNARSVQALNPGGGRVVGNLLLIPAQFSTWQETNLNLTPLEALDRMEADEEGRFQRFRNVTIAVTVSDSDSNVPADAAHARVAREGTPRLVVFGTSSWLSDPMMAGAEGSLRLDLLTSCLSWLREKSSIGATIPPTVRKDYTLNVPPEQSRRLRFLPLGLMMLGVAGLGTGVWVVRRR